MQTGRVYLRVLLLASAMVLGSGSLGESQAGVDRTTVSARAAAISADIDARVTKAQNEDAKKCLRDKKTAVNNLKATVATAADLSSLLNQLNEIAGQLDSCTAGPGGTPSTTTGTGSSPAAGAQVQVQTDADTPDPNESNPSVLIPPGHEASGPGVIDEGGGGGPDFGGGEGGEDEDVGQQPPVIPPPPVSPTM